MGLVTCYIGNAKLAPVSLLGENVYTNNNARLSQMPCLLSEVGKPAIHSPTAHLFQFFFAKDTAHLANKSSVK